MIDRLIRLASALCLVVGMTLLGIGCSLPLQRQSGHIPSYADQRIDSQRIFQLNFGRDASFGVCAEPACPTVTRKTLPEAQSAVPTPQPTIDTASTLDSGELRLTARQGIGDKKATPDGTSHAPLIVHFASGSAMLSAPDKAALNRAVPFAHQTDHIIIAGRTDNVGNNSANQALALMRARTVRNYLRARLPTRSYTITLDAQGACCFSASNDTPEGRRQNRRVEIVFRVPWQVAP